MVSSIASQTRTSLIRITSHWACAYVARLAVDSQSGPGRPTVREWLQDCWRVVARLHATTDRAHGRGDL